MLILTIRTDKVEAEIGLFRDFARLQYENWEAHRQLAESLHLKIERLLKLEKKDWKDLGGLIAYRGPGSFTGLRIGLTVANTVADGLGIPIVGSDKVNWIETGLERITSGQNDKNVLPFYGAPVHITKPK